MEERFGFPYRDLTWKRLPAQILNLKVVLGSFEQNKVVSG